MSSGFTEGVFSEWSEYSELSGERVITHLAFSAFQPTMH